MEKRVGIEQLVIPRVTMEFENSTAAGYDVYWSEENLDQIGEKLAN